MCIYIYDIIYRISYFIYIYAIYNIHYTIYNTHQTVQIRARCRKGSRPREAPPKNLWVCGFLMASLLNHQNVGAPCEALSWV